MEITHINIPKNTTAFLLETLSAYLLASVPGFAQMPLPDFLKTKAAGQALSLVMTAANFNFGQTVAGFLSNHSRNVENLKRIFIKAGVKQNNEGESLLDEKKTEKDELLEEVVVEGSPLDFKSLKNYLVEAKISEEDQKVLAKLLTEEEPSLCFKIMKFAGKTSVLLAFGAGAYFVPPLVANLFLNNLIFGVTGNVVNLLTEKGISQIKEYCCKSNDNQESFLNINENEDNQAAFSGVVVTQSDSESSASRMIGNDLNIKTENKGFCAIL